MPRTRFIALAFAAAIISGPALAASDSHGIDPLLLGPARQAVQSGFDSTVADQPKAPEVDSQPAGTAEEPKTPPPTVSESSAKPAAGENKPANSAEAKPVAAPPVQTLTAKIDLGAQTMVVSENGAIKHTWPVSSGVEDYPTPRGTFHPQWLAKLWFSKKYDNAPMPNAVFINGGVAIHATYQTSALGRPASHGCIRLSPSNAKTFYALVQKHGKAATTVSIFGTPKWRRPQVANRTYDWKIDRGSDSINRGYARNRGFVFNNRRYYAESDYVNYGGRQQRVYRDDSGRRYIYVPSRSSYGY